MRLHRGLFFALIAALIATGAARRRAITPPAAETPGVLAPAGTMTEARSVHSSTLLPNGLVLLAGGLSSSSLRTAELYDPTQRTFRRTGSMLTARAEHSATLLPDGKVLITGGLDGGGTLSSTEFYDPATGRFSAGPSMTTSRSGHVTARLSDGRILLTGGTIGTNTDWTFHSSAEIYDPATRRFSATGSMSVPRASQTMTVLLDGHVLIAGGHSGRHAAIQIYSTAEVYDPTTGTFHPTGAMSRIRHKHDAVLLRDGRVLINGGADARDELGTYHDTEIYDPAIGTFMPGPNMQRDRYKHDGTSLALTDGRILIGGGADQAEIFNPFSRTFTLVGGDTRMLGSFSRDTLLPSGQVLITGGYGLGHGATNSAWLFAP